MGGVVNSAVSAVQAGVGNVVNAVKTIPTKPLQGLAGLAVAPIAAPLAAVGTLAPATSNIPIVGTLTAGAGSASSALDSISKGEMPKSSDLRNVTAAGGVIAGGGMDGGVFSGFGDTGFDFSSFLNPAPRTTTVTKYAPAPASSGNYYAPSGSLDFMTVALLGGVAVGGFLILKRM